MAPEKHQHYAGSVLNQQQKKEYQDFLQAHLQDLTLTARESEGFLYISAEHIRVIPAAKGMVGGILEIREPREAKGHEGFSLRDQFEKEHPIKTMEIVAEYENKVFNGELAPTPFYLELGARVCLSAIKLYETRQGTFVSITVLPDTGQRFSKRAKLTNTNLIRGTRYPYAWEVLKAALQKEEHNFDELQKLHPYEQVVSQANLVQTGLWTIRFINKKGRYTDLKNCHVQREPQTGTLEVFLIQKQFIFEDIDNVSMRYHLDPRLKRVMVLVQLKDLTKVKDKEPLRLTHLYLNSERIKDIDKLPQEYHGLIEKEDGQLFLKEFHATPMLRVFLHHEKKVVIPTSEQQQKDIRQKIGQLFEQLVEKVVGVPKNKQFLVAVLPPEERLKELIEGMPDSFKNWALSYDKRDVVVRPDFILGDGSFIEVKSGGKMDLKPDKVDQLYRMVLYKLIQGAPLGIRYLMLDESTHADPVLPSIVYENIRDTEFASRISPEDMEKIRSWQQYLV